jgi:hypothetical protein
MTQVVICIIASDRQVKKSNNGLPRSSIIANVTPRNTKKMEKLEPSFEKLTFEELTFEELAFEATRFQGTHF